MSSLRVELDNDVIQMTASVGVATREPAFPEADDMVQGADKALYAAKKAGRDRVCVFTQGKALCARKDD